MYVASRNQGAQLNNRRIRVSGQRRLKYSMVTTGHPARDLPNFDAWLRCSNVVARKAGGIRHTGSAALDLAYVACGRIDAFWEPQLKIWDVAAGSLLVREARGLVTDFDGQQGFLESGNIVAGNAQVFSELLSIIKSDTGGSILKPEA